MWKVAAVFVGLLITMALGDALRPGGDPDEWRMAWGFASCVYGLLPFAFLYPRLWRPHETPGLEVMRTVTTDGTHCRDGETEAFIPWEQVVRARSSVATAVIYMRGIPGALIFPRHMFSSLEDWQRFRELLRASTI